ncbi:MAG: hypothetical protein U5N55_10515 [Cypionkella sp.]|nr:hypothetical protein [Cypionkella sp.]
MFFAQTADWAEWGRTLMGDLGAQFGAQGFDAAKVSLVVTAPGDFGAVGFAHRARDLFYPAGMAAPFHLVHGLAAQGRVRAHPDFDRALRDMILWPSDTAANYVIDCLTGTTGDTGLEGAEYLDWASKRAKLDLFFWQLGWPEWEGCRIVQKQGSDLRYGREARLAGDFGTGSNTLNAACAARLLWEMFEGNLPLLGEGARRVRALMQRGPASPDAVFPGYGLAEFLGGDLPAGVKIWSKSTQTGWTGDAKTAWVKHDMLRLAAHGLRPLHIVMMTQSRALAQGDGALFPAMGRAIWEKAAPLLRQTAQEQPPHHQAAPGAAAKGFET